MTSSDNKDTAKLAIALAQLNPHLGNVKSNTEKLIAAHAKAANLGADILLSLIHI